METGLILPDIEDVDKAPFWAAARERRLVVQRCNDCARLRFPPRPFCSDCRSESYSWIDVSGRGTIWSFIVHHNPTLPAYAEFTPFAVVVVQLAEDHRLRMTGNVVAGPGAAINSVDPGRLTIGMPVRITFQDVAPDVTLPYWMPAVASETAA